ncbi:MAG: transcription antitermination factor NusB [bacterium]|jgi:N utilization substance protein B
MNENFKADDLNSIPVDAELEKEQSDLLEQEEQAVEFEIEDYLKQINLDSRKDERVVSFLLIYALDRFDYDVSLESVSDNYLRGFNLVIPKNSFAFKMAQGAVDNRDDLDAKMVPFLKNWKLERLGCCTRLILRLALWELSQPDPIPSIVINEAVELAKIFAEKDAYKFVNGLLDEFCKQNGLVKPE